MWVRTALSGHPWSGKGVPVGVVPGWKQSRVGALSSWLGALLRGLKDRPADFGPPLRHLTGGTGIDQIILAHGTHNRQGMLGNVGTKRSIGGPNRGECTLMARDPQPAAGHHQQPHRSTPLQ